MANGFCAKAVHTVRPERDYRVEFHGGALCFVRPGEAEAHPHNFTVTADSLRSAVFLPKRVFASFFHPHCGRLLIRLSDGAKWELHFDKPEELQAAFQILSHWVPDRMESELA